MSDHITPYYLHLLNACYSEKKQRNSSYSIRSFAKQLDVNPGVLNQIMNGKRGLPFQLAEKFIEKLKLPETQQDLFMRSAFYSKQELDTLQKERAYKNVFLMTESEQHRTIMLEWEYYAFIALMDVQDFNSNLGWCARKLGIQLGRMEEVVELLLNTKIIGFELGNYKCEFDKISYGIDRDSKTFQQIQKKNLVQASEKIESCPDSQSHYNSITLAIQPKNIRRAKLLIDDFIVRLTSLLEDGEQDDVYKFNVQLFPVSKTQEELNLLSE
jgi:uncharacterized protein (TIGR02147 family)